MTASCKIRYLKPAQRDLIGIFDYIALDNPAAATNLLDKIDTKIRQLERFPLSGIVPRDASLRNRGYRILVVHDYLVFYKIVGRTIYIWRVIHGRRRYEFLV